MGNFSGETALTGSRQFKVTRKDPSNKILLWKIKNFFNFFRGWRRVFLAQFFNLANFYGVVSAKVFRADGTIEDYGVVSMRVVTDVGVGYIVDAFQNSVELENMKYHGFGTGTTTESAAQTALVTELTTEYATNSIRPTGSTTEGATGNIFRSVGTLSPDASCAITEHGIFSASSAGVLMDRSVFSAINLVGGDSLQITYDLTFASGS